MPRYAELYRVIREIAIEEATAAQQQQYLRQKEALQLQLRRAKQVVDQAKQRYAVALKALNDFVEKNAAIEVDSVPVSSPTGQTPIRTTADAPAPMRRQ